MWYILSLQCQLQIVCVCARTSYLFWAVGVTVIKQQQTSTEQQFVNTLIYLFRYQFSPTWIYDAFCSVSHSLKIISVNGFYAMWDAFSGIINVTVLSLTWFFVHLCVCVWEICRKCILFWFFHVHILVRFILCASWFASFYVNNTMLFFIVCGCKNNNIIIKRYEKKTTTPPSKGKYMYY